MRKVILKMNELEKYNVIKEVVDHNYNKKRAAHKLGITLRHVNRLIILYKEKGKSGFVHGNRSRKPAKTLDSSLVNRVLFLYQTKYQGFNFRHFYEYLLEVENIHVSYTFVYTTLMKNGFSSPKARKATKRRIIKERLLDENKIQNKSDDESEIIVNHEVALENSHPRGQKPKYFGEITEMDGSIHLWFGYDRHVINLG